MIVLRMSDSAADLLCGPRYPHHRQMGILRRMRLSVHPVPAGNQDILISFATSIITSAFIIPFHGLLSMEISKFVHYL